MSGWARTNECCLCGSPRCVVSITNTRVAYCFRFAKRFFINKNGQTKIKGVSQNRQKEQSSQDFFDFEENDYLDFIDAFSG